jgi:hypothetical protein
VTVMDPAKKDTRARRTGSQIRIRGVGLVRFNAFWMKSFEFMLTQQVPMRRVKSQRCVVSAVNGSILASPYDRLSDLLLGLSWSGITSRRLSEKSLHRSWACPMCSNKVQELPTFLVMCDQPAAPSGRACERALLVVH